MIYLSRSREAGQDLLKALTSIVAGGGLEVYYDLKGFAARIHRPKDPSSVAIIWDPDQQDLQKIGGMRRLLTGVRTLLVLPDGNPDTITLAHKILPSYISYVDDGISEIVSVLERLTGTGRKEPPPGARH
jgi:hypothetical protein